MRGKASRIYGGNSAEKMKEGRKRVSREELVVVNVLEIKIRELREGRLGPLKSHTQALLVRAT